MCSPKKCLPEVQLVNHLGQAGEDGRHLTLVRLLTFLAVRLQMTPGQTYNLIEFRR